MHRVQPGHRTVKSRSRTPSSRVFIFRGLPHRRLISDWRQILVRHAIFLIVLVGYRFDVLVIVVVFAFDSDGLFIPFSGSIIEMSEAVAVIRREVSRVDGWIIR